MTQNNNARLAGRALVPPERGGGVTNTPHKILSDGTGDNPLFAKNIKRAPEDVCPRWTGLDKQRAMLALVLAGSHKELPPAAVAVGAVLIDHFNTTTGQCDPSRALLARETGLDERSVRRGVAALVGAGAFAVRHNGGKWLTNAYEPRRAWFEERRSDLAACRQSCPVREDNPVRSGRTALSSKPFNRNLKKESPQPPKGASGDDSNNGMGVGATPRDTEPDIAKAVASWNATATEIGGKAIDELLPATKRKLRRILNRYGADRWREACDRVARTPYLQGENRHFWKPDVWWLASAGNFEKVLSGTYGNASATPRERASVKPRGGGLGDKWRRDNAMTDIRIDADPVTDEHWSAFHRGGAEAVAALVNGAPGECGNILSE